MNSPFFSPPTFGPTLMARGASQPRARAKTCALKLLTVYIYTRAALHRDATAHEHERDIVPNPAWPQ